jgi:mono/diheme cytochrome c family protein
MPQFAGTLKDAQIAAVATYIRNSWGNEFGAITEAESAALR